MSPEDVLTWLHAAPFRPFRLYMNSGKTYEIRHPEMLRVGRSMINVYSFAGEPTDPFECMEMISLFLLQRIEPVDAPVRV